MVWPDRLVLRRLFSRTVIPKETIVSIELMARAKSTWGLHRFVDAIVIDQTGGRIRIRVDDYSNAAEIKRAIQRYLMPGQPAAAAATKVPPATIAGRSPARYSRSWLTSSYGLMFWGLTIISWLFFLAVVSGPLYLRVGLPGVLTLAAYFGGGHLLPKALESRNGKRLRKGSVKTGSS